MATKAAEEARSEALAAAEAKARNNESEIERLKEQLRSSEAAAAAAAEAAAAAHARQSAPAVMQDRVALRLSPRPSTAAGSMRQSPAASPPASGRLSEVGRVPASVKSMGSDSDLVASAPESPEWVKCRGDESSKHASSSTTGEDPHHQLHQLRGEKPSGSLAEEASVKDTQLDDVADVVGRTDSGHGESEEDTNAIPGISDDDDDEAADQLGTPSHHQQQHQEQQQQPHQQQHFKPDLLASGGGFTDDESDSLEEDEKHTPQGTVDGGQGGHEAADGASSDSGKDEDDGFGDDSVDVSGDDLDGLLH